MRAMANDRALKNLGVRELNLGSLPAGVKIVNLPNQVSEQRGYSSAGWRLGGGPVAARFVCAHAACAWWSQAEFVSVP